MKDGKKSGTISCFSIAIISLLSIVSIIADSSRADKSERKLEEEEYSYNEYGREETGQGVNVIETQMLKASSMKAPSELNAENTYAIISTLDHEDDWVLGKIDDTYLSLNQFLSIESNNYRILVNDNSYRMVVNKYDQDYNKLGYVDLCHGDILNIDNSVKYATISIYKYENRQIINHNHQKILSDLERGLVFSISKISNLDEHITDKEQLTAQINMDSLSNYSNYRKGWFKSWGGGYESSAGSLCTRNFYKVDSMPYVINVNDSRITLSISEYNAEGKWVKYTDNLLNGGTFKKQPSTAYVGIAIKSRKWGVDLEALFKSGLRIDLASEAYMDSINTIGISKADLSDVSHWIVGSYLYETGDFIIETNKICYDSFCKINDEEYMVNLPGGYLKMNILELDKKGKVVKSNELQSGQKWRKAPTTDKIAITVYGNGKTFTMTDYKRMITEYPKFGIEKYVKYTHNTQMRDLTAVEFINKVNVGWNLGNSLDSKSTTSGQTANLKQELNWGNPYITKDLIDYVAKCGFNTIRIPVTWTYNTYKDENGDLRISQEWLNRVQEVVDYGIANDLYVILNTHHEQPIIYAGTDDASMKQVLENAQVIWAEIAEHFKTYDEYLIFESYNEVDNKERSWNYSDRAAAQMNELNQIFVDTVRRTGANNASRILIVPTLLDGADSRFYSGFQMPKDVIANKIVVQVHIYTKKFNQDIESEFTQLQEFSKQIKAPIVIGEFGTTPKYTLLELREEQAANFVARAAKYGIKCIWWDNGSDYKIIDRRDVTNSNMEMIGALLEGAQGIGYELNEGMTFNTIKQFAYLMPNIKTGKLESKYWGTLTTDTKGSAILIPEGSICTISLRSTNEAASVWLQRLLFYDTSGALVENGKEIQAYYYVGMVPENVVTMRVSLNSPNLNISLDNFKKYLVDRKIEMVIRCFNVSDVKKIKLIVTPYQ